MEKDIFAAYQFLDLVVGEDAGEGALLVQFADAPAKPGPGLPGSEPGDILLTSVEGPGEGTILRVTVSLGKPDKISLEAVRKAGAGLARWLIKHQVERAHIDLPSLVQQHPVGALGAFAEGLLLGAFSFRRRKSDSETPVRPVVTVTPGSEERGEVEAAVQRAQIVCGAVNLARDWGHEPANIINPSTLAERVREIAGVGSGLTVRVLEAAELAELGAGGIVNVGKGSQTPPCLVVMEYAGQGQPDARPVVLVGKALTFDSGGYSIKDVTNIQGMKYDKCGGMAVIATMLAAPLLDVRTPLVGIVGAAENMISAEAYRPDDILTMLNGKTVEIVTTDAEGRLVLGDALTYAQKNYQPRALIDLATLTGGVVVALGRVRAGIMGNDDALANQLQCAGDTTHERLWRLPLDEDYFANIKGDDADIKNSGGREGHAIYGGLFLQQFVDAWVPWAHLDIAGVADTPKEQPYSPKGATGFGVRLLLEYLNQLDSAAPGAAETSQGCAG